MIDTAVQTPSGLRQLRSLIRLWWLQMRRRAVRVGEAPKLSGAPTFLLLTLFSAGYIGMFAWQGVYRNTKHNIGNFTWHMLGVLALGFGLGLTKRWGRMQLRGTRSDTFLDAMPIRTLARLGLPFADTITFIPLTMAGALAGISIRGSAGPLSATFAVLLGFFAFANCYVVGSAAIAWIRAVGPDWAARWGGYLGLALALLGMSLSYMPFGSYIANGQHSLATRVARLWIGPAPSLWQLYGMFLGLGSTAYGALVAAEHYGIDQLDPQIRAPKASKRFRDRVALERVMILRQGGSALLVVFTIAIIGAAALLVYGKFEKLPPSAFMFATGFAIYIGALQTIGQAGRAARADQAARPFLSALPISPHGILDGKTRALRLLLIPVLVFLAVVAVASVMSSDSEYTYRIILSMVALFVFADGAVSISFLSTGVGMLGITGAQSTSGFSTQILMLPLFATVVAPSNWSSTTACIASLAVCFESHRAARMNVRWIDDPADDLDRETTVWRALLAASAFFAMQAMSYRVLTVAGVSPGYALAGAFGSSAALLALLTWRNDARIARPRFLPSRPVYWLLGVLAGISSGAIALGIVKLFPPPSDEAALDLSGGEVVATVLMMTVIAPLVEEYFFRGWLQRAIAADLPESKKQWAFVLGASAFALAHFGTYGVPQLVLGLLSGLLFARGGGLWPCIVAHALHNTIALWFAK